MVYHWVGSFIKVVGLHTSRCADRVEGVSLQKADPFVVGLCMSDLNGSLEKYHSWAERTEQRSSSRVTSCVGKDGFSLDLLREPPNFDRIDS